MKYLKLGEEVLEGFPLKIKVNNLVTPNDKSFLLQPHHLVLAINTPFLLHASIERLAEYDTIQQMAVGIKILDMN